jgi:hypothetical protein
MLTLSPAGLAALSLHNAKRHVAGRFDGAWWIIDAAFWSIVCTLPRAELNFFNTLVGAGNDRRERVA